MKNSHSNVLPDQSSAPVPRNNPSRIKVALTKMVGEDPYRRFGTQLIRIASDMIAVCNEDLEIIFHNRAFLKGMGYRDGSFTGQSLLAFFPSADRFDAESAFSGLANGHAAGLRINASVLTRRAISQFDIRVVKSLMKNGEFLFYLISREVKRPTTAPEKIESVAVKNTSFFDALPVAVWRTDKRLKIIDAEGSLWSELNVNAASLIGESVEAGNASILPHWFRRLDFCDTMAGQSLHLEVCDESGNFDVTIEPVLNEKSRVIGTVGFLRKSKNKVGRNTDAEARFPVPVDTIAIAAAKLAPAAVPLEIIEHRPAAAMPETVKVALPAITDAADRARASVGFQAQGSQRQVFPRPMAPPSPEEIERQRRANLDTKAVSLSR